MLIDPWTYNLHQTVSAPSLAQRDGGALRDKGSTIVGSTPLSSPSR